MNSKIVFSILALEMKTNFYFFQISAVIIIKMTWQYWILTVGLVVGGGFLFYLMMWVGEKLVQKELQKEKLAARDQEILKMHGNLNIALDLGE